MTYIILLFSHEFVCSPSLWVFLFRSYLVMALCVCVFVGVCLDRARRKFETAEWVLHASVGLSERGELSRVLSVAENCQLELFNNIFHHLPVIWWNYHHYQCLHQPLHSTPLHFPPHTYNYYNLLINIWKNNNKYFLSQAAKFTRDFLKYLKR